MALSYTTVPFLWRRHLGAARAVLAAIGAVVYALEPGQFGAAAVVALGGYALYATWLASRDSAESNSFPAAMLPFDTALLFCCAMHPSAAGFWLATVTFFFLMCVATLLHGWKVTLVLVCCTAAFFLIVRPEPGFASWPAVVVAGPLAVVLSLQKQVMQEKLSVALRRSLLSRSEAELARENERQRIAGDFHDGPLQSFISFQMRLEIIRKLMQRDQEAAMHEVVQLQELGRAQVTELRAFVRGMQPVEVTPANIAVLIRETVEHFERDSGVSADLFIGDLTRVDETMVGDVLQIVREALNNVRKHSKAARVSITVEASPGSVEIAVEDDGSGFPFSGSYTLDELEILRLGPRSIKRRVRTLNGDLTLNSRPMSGATLRIRVPVT